MKKTNQSTKTNNNTPSLLHSLGSKTRGTIAQTGSERGTFRYKDPHPVFGDELLFECYRVTPKGETRERWVTPERSQHRHHYLVSKSLERARANGAKPKKYNQPRPQPFFNKTQPRQAPRPLSPDVAAEMWQLVARAIRQRA